MKTNKEKLLKAADHVRQAIALVESVAENQTFQSLVGIHPRLRELFDDLRNAASDTETSSG